MKIRELTKNDLLDIVMNLSITRHSRNRSKERNGIDTTDFIVRTILDSEFGCCLGKNEYNIKIGKSEKYFVIHKDNNNIYHLITIKQLSYSGTTLKEKYEIIRKKYLTNKNESNRIELRKGETL